MEGNRTTLKSSTIFVSIGKETQVFRSVHEIPQKLRKQLVHTTGGWQSATILIADRRGRAELARALQGEPSPVQSRLAGSGAARRLIASRIDPEMIHSQPAKWFELWLRRWPELCTVAAVGIALWLVFGLR